MPISDTMNAKLNDQITLEFAAAHKYLAMSCLLADMSLKVLSQWFHRQSTEEREHGMKIVRYLQEVGGQVHLESIPKPSADYGSVMAIAEAALQSEVAVTNAINTLVEAANSEGDFATRSFLNWFVDEQVEEVAAMTDLVNLVKLAGENVLQVESLLRHQMSA